MKTAIEWAQLIALIEVSILMSKLIFSTIDFPLPGIIVKALNEYIRRSKGGQ